MDYNDFHHPLQSAYKIAHSTELVLLKVQNDILRTVYHGGVAVLVLLDLSAAFDTINHSVLLDRMRHQLGINGVVHVWFESYLIGRTRRIRIGDAWSLAQFLLYCVTQGSVLGPLLFLIYILPLHHLILSHGLQVHIRCMDMHVILRFTCPYPIQQTQLPHNRSAPGLRAVWMIYTCGCQPINSSLTLTRQRY